MRSTLFERLGSLFAGLTLAFALAALFFPELIRWML
jgi:hypothetical protein